MGLPAENLDTSSGTAAEAPAEDLSLHDQLDAAFTEESTDEPLAAEGTGLQRTRDELGRFAPEAQGATKAPQSLQDARSPVTRAQGSQQGAAAPQGQAVDKAPASWTPTAREKWGGLDPAVRAEIHRRESDMGRAMQESAQARQFIDAFEGIVRPYEVFIRQEGSNPLAAVNDLFQKAAELRLGTPGSKAALIASLINEHGVDIPMLDTLLANRQQIAQMQQMNQRQQFQDPRVDQLLAHQQRQMQANDARETADIRNALNGFAQTHEFYPDVAGMMADIVEMRAARGEPIDIERIYAQACQLHDGVSGVMSQRATARPQMNRQAVLRARRAAVSVSGESTPGGATIPEDDSIRSLLSAAMDQQTR